ncbi:MAG: hypothetical protein QOG77_210, partial [Solirubrobacteraceae bacterium]|nr:hypothetical protein [Solirubrobacteraceae bacterium]
RAHAERDAARGLGEHAAMHVREAELHDLAAEHQEDAARTQHQHADEHP